MEEIRPSAWQRERPESENTVGLNMLYIVTDIGPTCRLFTLRTSHMERDSGDQYRGGYRISERGGGGPGNC